MSKLTVSDKKFYAFLAAVAAGCVAFVMAATAGVRAFAIYCNSADLDYDDEV